MLGFHSSLKLLRVEVENVPAIRIIKEFISFMIVFNLFPHFSGYILITQQDVTVAATAPD